MESYKETLTAGSFFLSPVNRPNNLSVTFQEPLEIHYAEINGAI